MLTLGDLQRLIGGRWAGSCPPAPEMPLGPVRTDSRQVETGDIFWALRGPCHSGEQFCAEAIARGASGCVVPSGSSAAAPESSRAWRLEVDDTLAALQQCATAHRLLSRALVIGVTGSVGKTTTRQMIHAVLGSRHSCAVSPRNFNNAIGVPLSLLGIRTQDRFAVIEMGASVQGEIAGLAEFAQPDLGVITCIADAHLGSFGGPAGVLAAKSELIASLAERGAPAVLPDDVRIIRLVKQQGIPYTIFGESEYCDTRARHVAYSHGLLRFEVESQRFEIPVWGRHFLASALAAVAVGRSADLSLREMAAALWQWRPPGMRCDVTCAGGARIIDDTYNASPAATLAALELLGATRCGGRRIAVLGDMLELGDAATLIHFQVGRAAYERGRADRLIACGEQARHTVRGAIAAGLASAATEAFFTSEIAAHVVPDIVRPGDLLLVKGSRGMQMERVVQAVRNGSNERTGGHRRPTMFDHRRA